MRNHYDMNCESYLRQLVGLLMLCFLQKSSNAAVGAFRARFARCCFGVSRELAASRRLVEKRTTVSVNNLSHVPRKPVFGIPD